MKKVVSYIVFLLLISTISNAQKVKYKDLFPILESKNYDVGESQLRSFLANSKNASHANAHLQMALLLEQKIKPLSIVNDSSLLLNYCDTLRNFLIKSRSLITDKEVRKNDQYYKAYHRRDLRTGEFGIKASHVISDIDDILKKNDMVQNGTRFLAVNLPRLEAAQEESKTIFEELVDGFDNEVSLALSLTEESRMKLSTLKEKNEIVISVVNSIQEKVATIPGIRFNADAEYKSIEQFGVDGLSNNNVYTGGFEVWEYEQFVDKIIQSADGEITTYLKGLIDENRKIDKVISRIDKADIPAERPTISESLITQATAIDPDNLIVNLLLFKENEALFKLLELKDEDETHIYKQTVKYDSLYKISNELDRLLKVLTNKNTPLEKNKYNSFIKPVFNRDYEVDRYLEEKKTWVKNREYIVEAEAKRLNETIKWGINQNDSIAVFNNELDTLAKHLTKYIAEDTVYYKVVAGFETMNNPLNGFIGRIDPGMNLLWKHSFESTLQNIDSIKSVEYYQLIPGDNELVTIHYSVDQKTYRFYAFNKNSGTVEWEVETTLENAVFDVKFNELTKETVVFLNDPDNLSAGEEVKYVVIDKSGKIRK